MTNGSRPPACAPPPPSDQFYRVASEPHLPLRLAMSSAHDAEVANVLVSAALGGRSCSRPVRWSGIVGGWK
jgi:hypothetical protein